MLAIRGGDTNRATLQIFQAGASGTPGPAAAPGWDKHTFGKPVTAPQQVRRPSGTSRWLVHVRLGSNWASGDYVARLTWGAHTDYAPFVLRPSRLGTAPVLVVEPTNTWHAYDVVDGDSWYLDPSVHVIDLTHPFASSRVSGTPRSRGAAGAVLALRPRLPALVLAQRLPGGLRLRRRPRAHLERPAAEPLPADRLRRPRGVRHVPHLRRDHRATANAGGNLAFLSANNFFYKVEGLGEHDDRPHAVARPRPARGGARRRAVRRLGRGQVPEPAVPHRQHRGRAVAVRGHGPPRRQPRRQLRDRDRRAERRLAARTRTSSPRSPTSSGPASRPR